MIEGSVPLEELHTRVDARGENQEHESDHHHDHRGVERLGLLGERRRAQDARPAEPDERLFVDDTERPAVGQKKPADHQEAADEVEPERDRPGCGHVEQKPPEEGERRRPAGRDRENDGEAPGRSEKQGRAGQLEVVTGRSATRISSAFIGQCSSG